MKGKELDDSRNKLRRLLWMVMVTCITFTGCMRWGQPLLSRAVLQYDSNVLKADKELLLLNIVRMHDDQPPHFTAASAITAGFSFTSTGGLGGGSTQWTNDAYTFGGLTLTATTTNNPTITIAPMQGKDFAQRLLNPIDIAFANILFLQQAPQIDKMLRLIGHSFLMKGKTKTESVLALIPKETVREGQVLEKPVPEELVPYPAEYLKKKGCDPGKENCLLTNRPTIGDCLVKDANKRIDRNHYQLFRQVVLHIKAIQLSGSLNFSQLCFDIPIEGTLRTAKELRAKDFKDTIDAFEKKYRWEETGKSVTKDEDKQEPKPITAKEGFILTNSGGVVEDTFKAAGDLKGTDMKDIVDALEKKYHWKKISKPAEKEEAFSLTKRYPITAITDFDFERIPKEKKISLLDKIFNDLELSDYIKFDQGAIIVLLRGDKEKNRWPIYGLFRLRNFRQVLKFLAESLECESEYEREYYVPPSEFTVSLLDKGQAKLLPNPLDNPDLTLKVSSCPRTLLMPLPALPERLVDIDYNGKIFWISSPQNQTDACSEPKRWENPRPLRWDKQVFDMLYEIFQMNRVEPPVSAPSLTLPVK